MRSSATQHPSPVLQLRRLVNGQPSPATCLVLKDARDYYTNYNAAPQAPFSPRPSPTAHVSQTAPLSQTDRPSAINVINESPSSPSVNTHSSVDTGLRNQPTASQTQAVWIQSHHGSQNSENIATGHRASLTEPRGNLAIFTETASVPVDPGHLFDAGNTPRSSFYQMPPNNEKLPSFAELEAEVDWYTRERTITASSIANHQPGPPTGLVTRRTQDAADRNMVDQFLPRKVNRDRGNEPATYHSRLHSKRLSQDDPFLTRYFNGHQDFANADAVGHYGAAHSRDSLRMRPDACATQQSYNNLTDLMRSAPARARNDPKACRGRDPDEQALGLLELNPIIAEEFRRACVNRLQQYQQRLDKAYNQRLNEMEDYTREWRNRTWDLWQALRAGQFNPDNMSKQSCLAWQGPQEMASSGRYRLPFIEIRVRQPTFLENGQARDDEINSRVLSSAFPATIAPTAPQTIFREVRLDHHQIHQKGTRSHPSGPSKSGESRSSYTQHRPVCSVLPEEILVSRPASGLLNLSQSDAFQNARHRAATCQPHFSGGSASAEIEVRQLAHNRSVNQPSHNGTSLLEPDSIPSGQVRAPLRRLLALEWTSNLKGYVQDSSAQYSSKSKHLLSILSLSSLESSFTSSLKMSYSAILLGVKSNSSRFDYHRFEDLQLTRNTVHPSQVIIDLSEANVLMFGKAFCYMQQRIDHLRSLVGLTSGRILRNNQDSQRMYHFFSQQPINRALKTMRHPENKRNGLPCRDPVHETRKLLIVRPEHEDGHITGAAYLDVGNEQPTVRADGGECLLPQGRCTRNCLLTDSETILLSSWRTALLSNAWWQCWHGA